MRLPLFLIALPLTAASVRIYVANSDGDNVHVIDPEKNQVAGEIKVSKNPHGIVFSPDKKRFYVSSESEDVLDIVDRASSKIIRRVPLGRRPNNVAITPDGRRVYICIRQESWVDVVDTVSMEKVKSIPVGRGPHNVYMTPDGKHMLATSMGDNRLTLIDISAEKVAREIPLPGVPRPLAMDPPANAAPQRLFVQLSNLHGFVSVDYATGEVKDKILLPEAPHDAKPLIPQTFSHGIGVTPGRTQLWVTSLLLNSVSVFSMPDLKRVATIETGRGPDWLTFTPDGKRVYVSNAGSNSVSVIDTGSFKELTRIAVGKIPKRIITVVLPD